jgi:phosphoribosylamine--glycine ligase
MMTAEGPKVLEYNVRFGDPETQSILVRLDTDLVDICAVMLDGKLGEIDIKWREGNSATIILASEGYPGKPRTGDVIRGLDKVDNVDGVTIFHSGTAYGVGGEIVTAGGRVLGVTSTGENLPSALTRAYEVVDRIGWEGMQYRKDIGK